VRNRSGSGQYPRAKRREGTEQIAEGANTDPANVRCGQWSRVAEPADQSPRLSKSNVLSWCFARGFDVHPQFRVRSGVDHFGQRFQYLALRIIQILQFLNVELSERAITHGRISSSSFLGVPLWASSTGTDRSPCYSITPPQPVKPDTGANSAHAIIAATGSSMEAELPNALAHDCYSNGKCLSFAWTGNITDKRRESTELPTF
jgi:hypothetical protein